MSAAAVILVTLVVYKIALLGIGLVANRWTRSESDFVLGGRSMGPLVAAISASASSSSVWTLLGVSGYAFQFGLSAVWLFPACIGGFALNWYVIAPRLREHSRRRDALTLSEVLAGPPGTAGRRAVLRTATMMILLAMIVYVASQLQGSGLLFEGVFEDLDGTRPSPTVTILIGATIIVIYTLLGGFWAVSLTDTLQGLMMAVTAVALPVAALVEVGGIGTLFERIDATQDAGFRSVFGDLGLAAAVGLVAGVLGIGLGYPGQPHVVNRFMALRDARAVVAARRYAMAWAFIVYVGMVALGLCGRVLLPDVEKESVFFEAAMQLFPAMVSGVMIASVLAAIMSTADSQLLVAATSISHDWAAGNDRGLGRSRVVVLALSAFATLFAIFGTQEIFSNVLSAWTAMGAAFGPLLCVVLAGRQLTSRATITTMCAGFGTAVLTHALIVHRPDLGGRELRWIPWVLPYAVAGTLAIATSRRPDR